MIRKHVYYSGNVQGVGFRYTAARIAAGYKVTGSVKNLPDNRVEMIVEGAVKQITAFMTQLEQAMAGYIRNTQILDEPYQGSFSTFSIGF